MTRISRVLFFGSVVLIEHYPWARRPGSATDFPPGPWQWRPSAAGRRKAALENSSTFLSVLPVPGIPWPVPSGPRDPCPRKGGEAPRSPEGSALEADCTAGIRSRSWCSGSGPAGCPSYRLRPGRPEGIPPPWERPGLR